MAKDKTPPPMKLAMTRAALKRLLEAADAVSNGKTAPILGTVLLTAAEEKVHAAATDMDIEMQDAALAEVAAAGTCAVSTHLLAQLAGRSAAEMAHLEVVPAEDALEVRIGRARARLPLWPTEDFPAWSGGDYSHSFQMEAGVLAGLLKRVDFAASDEDARYYLQGIYLHAGGPNGQSLRAVATDGHRLAMASTLLPGGAEGMPGIIIPAATVKRILKLFTGGEVQLDVSDTRIRLSCEGTAGSDLVLSSKLIDGTFPDYERVVPTGQGSVIEVERVELIAALRRALAFASSKAVRLTLAEESLTVLARHPDSGSLTEDVDAGGWDGTTMDVGANAAFLSEALDHLDGERVQLVVEDPTTPILIRDPADPDVTSVLIPMRV